MCVYELNCIVNHFAFSGYFVAWCVAVSDSLKSDISLVHEIALKRKFSVEFAVRTADQY